MKSINKPNPHEECTRCGLQRATCEMNGGSVWVQHCKAIEGKKHDFKSNR